MSLSIKSMVFYHLEKESQLHWPSTKIYEEKNNHFSCWEAFSPVPGIQLGKGLKEPLGGQSRVFFSAGVE